MSWRAAVKFLTKRFSLQPARQAAAPGGTGKLRVGAWTRPRYQPGCASRLMRLAGNSAQKGDGDSWLGLATVGAVGALPRNTQPLSLHGADRSPAKRTFFPEIPHRRAGGGVRSDEAGQATGGPELRTSEGRALAAESFQKENGQKRLSERHPNRSPPISRRRSPDTGRSVPRATRAERRQPSR